MAAQGTILAKLGVLPGVLHSTNISSRLNRRDIKGHENKKPPLIQGGFML
jgi:hypothetical protein